MVLTSGPNEKPSVNVTCRSPRIKMVGLNMVKKCSNIARVRGLQSDSAERKHFAVSRDGSVRLLSMQTLSVLNDF